MFNLNKNLSYFIFLHEPDFFLVTYNPVTLPSTDQTLSYQEVGDNYMTLTLEVKQQSGVKVWQGYLLDLKLYSVTSVTSL